MGLKDILPPFLLGLFATSFQIILLREFSAHFYGNELTFGLVLASWLLWGGLGSLTASRIKFNLNRIFLIYYLLLFLFPAALIALRFSRFILGLLPGEITGLAPVFIISLVLSFLVSFPLGALFVFNVRRSGNLARVYILESLGASVAGAAVYFFFIPLFSHWLTISLLGLASAGLLFLLADQKKKSVFFGCTSLFLIAFAVFDLPSQKLYWNPFKLLRSKDTPYGKQQVIKTEDQTSLYSNSLHVYSYPNREAAEESIHFALLQNPEAEDVLLIGGGSGGGLRELLKYPRVRVDYVELDPEVIHLSFPFLPAEEQKIFSDPRVHIIFQDGRAFLQRAKKTYEMIILNLPDPSTAQLNRFYTIEFFLEVQKKLAPGGVFSFRVSSAENYISAELQQYLSTLYRTIHSAFPEVEIVPGDTNIFLASAQPLSIQSDELGRKIKAYNLNNTYVSTHFLFSRLDPRRIKMLKDKISFDGGRTNLDFVPVSFFFHSLLWSTQFQDIDVKVMTFLARLSSFWTLDFPLLIFLLVLIFFWIRRRKTGFFMIPLLVLGFSTIVIEIILIIWFQALYGYLYGRIALLLSCFMLGLFLGSWLSSRRRTSSYRELIVIQAGLVLLLMIFQLFLHSKPPEASAFVYLLLVGFLAGNLFIVSNNLYLREKTNYGLGYGLDLIGSFLGALVTSSFMIPLIGLPVLLKYLTLINSFCLVFLIGHPRGQSG